MASKKPTAAERKKRRIQAKKKDPGRSRAGKKAAKKMGKAALKKRAAKAAKTHGRTISQAKTTHIAKIGRLYFSLYLPAMHRRSTGLQPFRQALMARR